MAAPPTAPAREPTGPFFGVRITSWRPVLIVCAITFTAVFVVLASWGNLAGMLVELAVLATALLAIKHPLLWILPCALELILFIDGGLTSSASFLIIFPALVDLPATGHLRAGGLVAMAAHLVFAASLILEPSVPVTMYMVLSFMLITVLLAGAWTRIHDMRRSTEQLAHQRTRQAERLEVSRSIHDTLAAQLSHIVMLSRSMDPELPDSLRTQNRHIHGEAQQGLVDLRALIAALRDDSEGHDPDARFTSFSEAWEHAIGLLTDLGYTPMIARGTSEPHVEPRVEELACICLREITGNIIRHAPRGAVVQLEFQQDSSSLRLSASNPVSDSAAPSTFPSSGFGLTGLRERLEELGGTLSMTRMEGTWITLIRIPLTPGTES